MALSVQVYLQIDRPDQAEKQLKVGLCGYCAQRAVLGRLGHSMWSLSVWWQNLYVRMTLISSVVEAASSGLSRAGAADVGCSSLCRDLTFS